MTCARIRKNFLIRAQILSFFPQNMPGPAILTFDWVKFPPSRERLLPKLP